MSMKNEKGYTIIGTMIIMMIMSYMGVNVADMSNTGSTSGVQEVQGAKALYVGNGGIQYALSQLDEGLDPDGTHALGDGSFTVSTDPNSRRVVVASTVGVARDEQELLAKFSGDKTDIDLRLSYPQGNSIEDIRFLKTEGNKVILTHMSLDWNWSDCEYNDACEGAEPNYVCHIPNGNQDNRHTIRASQDSVQVHLDHGDSLGKCYADERVRGRSCEGTDDEVSECYQDTGGVQVSGIALNGTSIFSGAANSGDRIDVIDQIFTEDQTYVFDYINFSGAVPASGWYSLTMYFADGSERTADFKFINQMVDNDDDDDDSDDDDDDDDDNDDD